MKAIKELLEGREKQGLIRSVVKTENMKKEDLSKFNANSSTVKLEKKGQQKKENFKIYELNELKTNERICDKKYSFLLMN